MRENIPRGERVSTINRQINRSLEASEGADRKASEQQEARELKRKDARCDGYRERLERIQQQLRAGYSNDKGTAQAPAPGSQPEAIAGVHAWLSCPMPFGFPYEVKVVEIR